MAKGFIRIADEAIKVWVPEVIQHTTYSCGAAALHAVCCYWGVGMRCDLDYIPYLEADAKAGTVPENIIYFARSVGLRARAAHDMEIAALKAWLDEGKPVICPIQAWGKKSKYRDKNHSGHYVTAIGYDKKHIYFEDSSLPGKRGYLTYKQFVERWHDEDYFGNTYNRYGIAIWKSGKPGYIYRAAKVG
jgi:predicted double-glycine peptidase